MKSYFENLKRENYNNWRKRQNLIGPVESYESWKSRKKIGTPSTKMEKDIQRRLKKRKVIRLRGDRFVDKINKKVKVDSYKAMARVYDEEVNKIFK